MKFFNKKVYTFTAKNNSNEDYLLQAFEDLFNAVVDKDKPKYSIRLKRFTTMFGYTINGSDIDKMFNAKHKK